MSNGKPEISEWEAATVKNTVSARYLDPEPGY